MIESVAEEIRLLETLVWSERDPQGRGFAALADAYRRAEQPRRAFEILSEGLERLPDFTPGHVVAARLYVEQGLHQEGEIAARRALELDPDNVRALAALALALEGVGREEESARVRASLRELEPEVLREEGLEGAKAATDPPGREGAAPEGAEWATDETLVLDVAPDEPADDAEPVLEVGALAPDDGEPVLGIAALAPEDAEPVLEVTALAPDPARDPAAEDDPVLEIADLAPSAGGDTPLPDAAELTDEVGGTARTEESDAPLPEEELVLSDQGLDVDAAEELVLDVRVLEPDPVEPEGRTTRREGGTGPASPGTDAEVAAGAPRIHTRTLGELYARQGFTAQAVEVYRHLAAERPDDADLARRLAELEAAHRAGAASAVARADLPPSEPPARERDEELEELARDLTMNREVPPEVETPFAWAEERESPTEPPSDGRSVREYFTGLLAWRRESEE